MSNLECVLRQIKRFNAEGNFQQSIELAQKAYDEEKCDCLLNEIASIYVKLKNRKEAIKYYQKIYKNDSNNLFNIKTLAYNLFFIGNFKEALKYYKKVLDFEPQKSEKHVSFYEKK